MSERRDPQWLLEHRDKIEPLMHALDRHLGPERLGDNEIKWTRMRNKDGSELMVATVHEMDYWIDPTTGDLRWEETVMEEKENEALAVDFNDFIAFACDRYSMSREELADLVNTMLLRLSTVSERHDVPFEDMLVKLLHVARQPPR